MKTTDEIQAEITALRAMLKRDGFNNTRNAAIVVLEKKLSKDEIGGMFYCDESDPDYKDGDNDLYHNLIHTMEWMNNTEGFEAPSTRL